jgi:hypothetical protein
MVRRSGRAGYWSGWVDLPGGLKRSIVRLLIDATYEPIDKKFKSREVYLPINGNQGHFHRQFNDILANTTAPDMVS